MVEKSSSSSESKVKIGYFSSTRIALIAILGALAGILYIFDFPLSFAFPSFLNFKLVDIPVLISSFVLGPVSAAITVVVEVLIKLVAKGTSTAFRGELADLLLGFAFAVPAGLIYSKKRTFKGALLGIGIGALCEVAVALLANKFILVPFYVKKYGWGAIIGMMTSLFPSCTEENFYNIYLWVSVLPFNLLRCLVSSVINILVYKRLSIVINRIHAKVQPKEAEGEVKAKKINLAVLLVGIAIVLLLVLFTLLRYFVFRR